MIERGDLPGFQKPLSSKPKPVGLAVVSYNGTDRAVKCSCGWGYQHAREKVREDAVDKHLKKKHNGRGIRL